MCEGTKKGKSPGNLKQMVGGNNCVLPIKNRKLVLGHAQDIYFAEFDGIKNRKYFIQLLGE
ncbi:YjbQ family protein [Streptococcus hyovaginalis]